jgi:hypothetical protein
MRQKKLQSHPPNPQNQTKQERQARILQRIEKEHRQLVARMERGVCVRASVLNKYIIDRSID